MPGTIKRITEFCVKRVIIIDSGKICRLKLLRFTVNCNNGNISFSLQRKDLLQVMDITGFLSLNLLNAKKQQQNGKFRIQHMFSPSYIILRIQKTRRQKSVDLDEGYYEPPDQELCCLKFCYFCPWHLKI